MTTIETLSDANAADADAFAARFADVFEHSPWIAAAAAAHRPFASVEALWRAMLDVVLQSSREQQLALIRAHPELAGREAMAGTLTDHSTGEQARLGLTALSPREFAELAELNRAYRETFGFPCIIALRLHADKDSVLATFRRRLAGSREGEIMAALDQIGAITRGRIEGMLSAGAGWLTTHVLDTHGGIPASGMALTLDRWADGGWIEVARTVTNAQGRTDQPLLAVGAMTRGRYRLTFDVAAYFRTRGVRGPSPAFLDRVPLEFGLAELDAHYHVPLLCSPWSYSTYRGS